jgi:ABC-type branched-subunit amino acid transport system ATPase component
METLVAAARRLGIKAIIQVEHDMDIVFGYSDRIVALHQGRVIADATPDGIRADAEVVATVIAQAPLMLEIERLNVHIQGSHILHDVSLRVEPRELVCLVGRNGAARPRSSGRSWAT